MRFFIFLILFFVLVFGNCNRPEESCSSLTKKQCNARNYDRYRVYGGCVYKNKKCRRTTKCSDFETPQRCQTPKGGCGSLNPKLQGKSYSTKYIKNNLSKFKKQYRKSKKERDKWNGEDGACKWWSYSDCSILSSGCHCPGADPTTCITPHEWDGMCMSNPCY